VRVLAIPILREFWERHADAEEPLKAWFHEAERATWTSPHDVQQRYGTADILADNRVCFNIRGNHYRLIVCIHYVNQVVLIKFIGTHEEYDRIDAETVGKPTMDP
jgi:mRNA interferase HigB